MPEWSEQMNEETNIEEEYGDWEFLTPDGILRLYRFLLSLSFSFCYRLGLGFTFTLEPAGIQDEAKCLLLTGTNENSRGGKRNSLKFKP
jgi:hypothetical protein